MYELPVTAARSEVQRGVLNQVYLWMAAGLLVTGAVATWAFNTPSIQMLIFGNPWVFFGLIIAQFALVIAIGPAVNRLSPAVATGLFLLYSALTGLTLSAIFLVYTQESIGATFFATAGTFAALSVAGHVIKRDLSGMGRFLLFALIGFLIGTIINIFWANSTLYWILTYAGVLIFAGLTVYDTQKIKQMAENVADDTSARRIAIYGALVLYLDFINLFLLLLRIFGVRRD